MTTHSMAAGSDPRRLLAHVRHLTRRVRIAQRVTWLPLLLLALVTFGAIPVLRYGWRDFGCVPVADGQMCHTRNVALMVYWQVALAASYVAIAYGYLRAARARGLGGRVLPYVVTGVALNVLVQAVSLLVVHEGWGLTAPDQPGGLPQPGGLTLFLFRIANWATAIGVALLVLAWLERNLALLLFTAGYLVVVLAPIGPSSVTHWRGPWGFLPTMAVEGGMLLLGGLGFALAQRGSRHR